MPISFSQAAVVAQPGAQYDFSSLVTVTSSSLPEYLVLDVLDIERYTSTNNGNHGTVSGNGQVARFNITDDHSNLSLIFTYTDKGYYNSTYGYLSDLKFTSSTDNFRNEFLSLYGFGTAGNAEADLYAALATEFNGKIIHSGSLSYTTVSGKQADATIDYFGTLDVASRSGYTDATPNQATPNEIAEVANSLVGQTWNINGCWVLANHIAASSGATLPLTSWNMYPDLIPPAANGEWFVAYDSSKATPTQQMNWPSLLRPGDIVSAADSCGGHVETVVSGFSYSARVIDNLYTYGTNVGNDMVIAPAHALNLVSPYPSDIVIYRLDAPVVTVNASLCLEANGVKTIAPLFVASDPAGKQVTSYQLYDTTGGSFIVGGATQTAHSASTAITVDAANIAGLAFKAGSATGSDSILVRAYNGSYWGDWQNIPVAIGSTVQPAQVHAVSDTVLVHGSQSVVLSALFDIAAQESPVDYYTITDPIQASNVGAVRLNGATDLLGGSGYSSSSYLYKISAADFSKLSYVGGSGSGGESITVKAHNGSALDSLPASVVLANATPRSIGISHWVSPGEKIPLSSLFFTQQYDSTPISSYIVSTNVTVLSWGSNHPSSGGTVQLNGAENLWKFSWIPGTYEIAAADLGKVTFQAAPDDGAQLLEVWANDGANGTAGTLSIFTITDAQPLTAKSVSLVSGTAVAAASLFSLNAGVAQPAYYRIVDPSGCGALHLSSDTTNLQSSNDLTPGVIVIRGSDLSKISYAGASGSGTESVTISTSSDNFHWSAEVQSQVTTTAAPVHLHITGTAGNDRLRGTAANDTIDGGNGDNTLVCSGKLSNYTLTKAGSGYVLKDNTGNNGTDSLSNIQHVTFSDVTVDLTVQSKAASISTSGLNSLVELYVAYFDRVPDASGLGYWIDQMNSGHGLEQIGESFYDAAIQYADKTGYSSSMTNADFVKVIYANVLGRTGGNAPPQADIDYWTNNLSSGADTRGTLIKTMLASAHSFKGDAAWGWVASLLENKVAAGKAIAVDMGISFNSADDDVTQGMAIADAVTSADMIHAISLIGIDPASLHL